MDSSATRLLDFDRATDYLQSHGIDLLVGSGYVNYGYITGYFTHFGRDYPGPMYDGRPLVRFAGLAADRGISPFLITYPGETSDIRVQGSWIEDRRLWGPTYKVTGGPILYDLADDPFQPLAEAVEERGLSRGTIGLDMSELPYAIAEQVKSALPHARLVDASSDFRALRVIKTPVEIERLRGAIDGVIRGHAAVRENLREDMTSLELASIVQRAVIDEYTDRYILHINVGERGATILPPTDLPIRRGEIVTVDVCSMYKNYVGDMTRVYAFGEQDSDVLEVHAALDEVNSLLVEAVRPGVKASDLYLLGKSEMDKRGLEMALDFVGHSLGIDVHEIPYLIPTDHTVLEPNMVVVLEVSMTRADLGRICAEITCVVTKDGCEVLGTLPYTITHVP